MVRLRRCRWRGLPIPDFIVELRQRIGHDPLWLPGITAVVLRGTEVLLVRRSDNGAWTPVTGIVDPGEHPVLAAAREVMEETGVSCEIEGLAWVNISDPVVHVNGDRAQYLDHTFRCRYLEGEARVGDEESTDVGWFEVDALPAMAPLMIDRIRRAVAYTGRTDLD